MSLMLVAFILNLIDFVLFAWLGHWFVYSLFPLMILTMVQWRSYEGRVAMVWSIALFLIQDFARHGRAGLALILLLPILWAIVRLRDTLQSASWVLLCLSTIGFIFSENTFFYAFMQGIRVPLAVTMMEILVNLSIGYVVLWNMLGNRSAALTAGRKVWTPNRKDAS